MQVKPWVWQYLVPAADAYDPAGNIRLGVAVWRTASSGMGAGSGPSPRAITRA